jgi:hypothetical protein
MTREDVIRMAREAGFKVDWQHADVAEIKAKRYEYFAALVAAAEREKVARWHIGSGYTTGHGDTIEDLLVELEWQVRESEREACAKVCEDIDTEYEGEDVLATWCAAAIRARSNT